MWSRDVVTGRSWPTGEAGFLDVDLRATGHDPNGPNRGDVKFIWEPARLQVLHPLAAAAAAGDEESARLALAVLSDFMRANPPHRGVHWCSGIELALRLVAVTLLRSGLERHELSSADAGLIRAFVAAHASQIAAFPSLHSSANNHRIAEGLGLFLAGTLVPDIDASWEREGRRILETEALLQILPDGAGAEQSPSYQAFSCEMIAFAALVAGCQGRPFAAPVLDRLAASAVFLRALMDETGRVPAIGDDDESRVIAQPPDDEPRYVASVVAAVAGLTGRPDLLPPARDPRLRDAIFSTPAGDRPVADEVLLFRDGGYTVARDTVAGRRLHLVFDHGPLGYLSLAAHGHADALSLWMSLDGIPVLIDPGTFLYNAGGAMRLALRESPSHNTLCLAGASQSRSSSAFTWTNRAEATLEEWRSDADGWWVSALHDGYRRRYGVHQRRRLGRHGDTLTVTDRLVGSRREHDVEIGFLIGAGLDLDVEADTVFVMQGADRLCRFRAPDGFAVEVRRGAGQGAVRARRFGELVDAQRIVFSGRMRDAEATTRISVLARGPIPGADTLARDLLDDPSLRNPARSDHV